MQHEGCAKMMFKPIELPRENEIRPAEAALSHIEQAAEISAETLLARAFVQEIHTAALLTVGCASAVNFSYLKGSTQPLVEAGRLMCGFQAKVDQWPKRILSEQLSPEVVQQTARFFEAVRRGTTSLHEYQFEADKIRHDRAASLHIAGLVADWRHAAQAARDVIETLRTDADPSLPEEHLQSGQILIKTLDEIIAGKPHSCSSDGTIILPQLAERRRAPRHTLLQNARVFVGQKSFDAFARDISSGGLGLTRMPPFELGMVIDVELGCGRSFRGRIAWRRGKDAGLAFDQPLSPTDPLIFG